MKSADLAEGDLLLQSSMLALFAHLTEQATVRYNSLPGSAVVYSGLRLWLIWEHDLSLARWRQPLVQWVIRDSRVAVEATTPSTSLLIHDLCAHHALWMHSPLDIGVPVFCGRPSAGEGDILAWRYFRGSVAFPLSWLVYRTNPTHDFSIWHNDLLVNPMGASVGLATVFEYIAAVYGVERIPLLLAALPRHEEVETLIPEVFDQTQDDFYRDWRAFMTERYGIMP